MSSISISEAENAVHEISEDNSVVGESKEAKEDWDETNVDLKDSGKKLKDKIIKCCKKKFSSSSPIDFIEENIPSKELGEHFEAMNKSRKAVQHDIRIEEKDYAIEDKPELKNWWTVEMDADRGEGDKEPKKFAHFGFTVQEKGKNKATGHIYLKEGQAPHYVRPPVADRKKLHTTALEAKKKKKGGEGNKGSIWYELTGDWSKNS